MRLGEKFIVAVVNSGNVKVLFELPEIHLYSSEEKSLFSFTKKYFIAYKELPDFHVLKDSFGDITPVSGSPEFYKDELLKRYIYTSLGEGVPGVIKGLKDNPLLSLEKLREIVSGLESSVTLTSDMPYFASVMERYKEYEERIGVVDGVTYISTGNKLLDSFTYGIRPVDLWTFGGRGGTKKTWWITQFAIACEKTLPKTFGPILLITNEIGLDELGERMDSINFKLGYGRLLSGNLTDAEEERYRTGAKRVKKKPSRIIVIFNCNTLEDLRFKIRMYSPSAVFLDGSYLLEPLMEEGIQKTTYITRNLKGIAKDTGVPIINTTQLRKKTGKKTLASGLDGQDQFFYGSYVQDSDFAIASFLEPDMVYRQEVGLDFVKARRMERKQLIWLSHLDKMEFNYSMYSDDSELPETDYELDKS